LAMRIAKSREFNAVYIQRCAQGGRKWSALGIDL
jgi:hypothetical protein